MNIYVRPLEIKDALISFEWRNNDQVWEYTGGRPDRVITKEIETNWIKEAIKRPTEKRYAICLKENDQYIGNAQLTHINDTNAQFHIFIGEVDFWGKGVGSQATKKIIELAFGQLKLSNIYLYVRKEHKVAIELYRKCGFQVIPSDNDMIKMEISKKLH